MARKIYLEDIPLKEAWSAFAAALDAAGLWRTLPSEIVDIASHLLEIRAVKSAWELQQIRDAARINDHVYRAMPEVLSEELSTCALQALLDARARQSGHVGVVRLRGLNLDCLIGIIVSGPRGAVPGQGFLAVTRPG